MNKGIIQVEGKFYKKCKVVMLPAEKATKGGLFVYKENVSFDNGVKANKGDLGIYAFECVSTHYQPQHLYILSDEPIKEDDQFIWKDRVYQFDWDRGYGIQTKTEETVIFNDEKFTGPVIVNHSNVVGKIVATTDPELINLPRPSDAFLKAYCEKGGIDEVLVEYERVKKTGPLGLDYFDPMDFKLKVSPDNTITVKEKLYSAQEVAELIISSFGELAGGMGYSHEKLDKWIEENL